MDWSILFVLLYMHRIVHSCLSLHVPIATDHFVFYLICDPRVSPARIQSRATIGPPANPIRWRFADKPAVPRFYLQQRLHHSVVNGIHWTEVMWPLFTFIFLTPQLLWYWNEFCLNMCFQSAEIKRCFVIIFYYFTILGFKNVKKKKISVLSVVVFNKSTSDFKPI